MGRILDALKQLDTQGEKSPAANQPAAAAIAPPPHSAGEVNETPPAAAHAMPLRSVVDRLGAESSPPARSVSAPDRSAPLRAAGSGKELSAASPHETADRLNNRFETSPTAPRGAGKTTPFERELQDCLSGGPRAQQYEPFARAVREQMQGVANPVIGVTAIDVDDQAAGALARLAVRLAADDEGGDVLLIDAGFGEPALSRQFDAAARAGLIEVFNLRKSWRELAVATSIPRLSLLPAGRGVLTSQQSAERAIGDLVSQWKSGYRYTLVHSGPLRSPGARMTLRQCDACYLQLRMGITSARRAVAAASELRGLGARVLGCIAADAQSP